MHIATNNAWNGSYTGAVIDGVDVWDALVNGESIENRTVVFHSFNSAFSCQIGDVKYMYNMSNPPWNVPLYTYLDDLDPSLSYVTCDDASLVDY